MFQENSIEPKALDPRASFTLTLHSSIHSFIQTEFLSSYCPTSESSSRTYHHQRGGREPVSLNVGSESGPAEDVWQVGIIAFTF